MAATRKSTKKSSTGGQRTSASSTKKSASSKKSGSSKKSTSQRTASAPRAEPKRKRSGARIADDAAQQLAELTSKEVEAVTGLERTDDGWKVEVEVLELRRVPSTTDVLATYEVLVDADGDLEAYRRRHRFVRGTPGEEGS